MKSLFSHSLGRVAGPRLGLLADSVNDANSTRKVYLLAAGLAALGIALVAITVWFWRSTRHDPELLAPLEVMGARRFKRLEGGVQRELLDRSRPVDAKPMRWGVRRGGAGGGPEIDLRESLRTAPSGYDDLLDPALIAVALAEPDDHSDEATSARASALPAALKTPLDDIDSALAAVGAHVGAARTPPIDAAPVPRVTPTPLVAAGAADPSAATAPAATPAEGSTSAPANTSGAAEPGAAAPAGAKPDPTVAASGPVLPPRGDKPGTRPAGGQPLVIVPVDHELRRSRPVEPQRTPEPAAYAEPEPVDVTTAAEVPALDEPTSIDPLLRMVNRDDS